MRCSRSPVSLSLTDSRGHGTYVNNDEVIASVAGVVERVNKLVTVRALRTRYVQRTLKLNWPPYQLSEQIQPRSRGSGDRSNYGGTIRTPHSCAAAMHNGSRCNLDGGKLMPTLGKTPFSCFRRLISPEVSRLVYSSSRLVFLS